MITLQRGSRGVEVTQLQNMLNVAKTKLGLTYANLVTDGAFGTNTETAVNQFKSKRGLPVNGIVDSATWNALSTVTGIAAPRPLSTSTTSSVSTKAAGGVMDKFYNLFGGNKVLAIGSVLGVVLLAYVTTMQENPKVQQ